MLLAKLNRRYGPLIGCSVLAAVVVVLVLVFRPSGPPPVYSYTVLATFPHDRSAYTQGLVYADGELYESTGLYGASSLRRVALATGTVLQRSDLADHYFAEGLALVDDRLIQLTWQSHVGFVYDAATFELLDTFSYATDGWGLAYDGEQLIMSDGTATLRFLDPDTLSETRTLLVKDGDDPVARLNELEYVDGEVWANVYQTDRIARISPRTGVVVGWIDLAGLLPPQDRLQPVDVLNGIAYDPATERILVTGKWWPKLFEISLQPAG
ncbi:MAG: glutaminyl-peptide cyclotransferase [Chloroflexi bacterium]|nr:glutaminyl-peptide cyclotransferase [Chloroflexota bacterium]